MDNTEKEESFNKKVDLFCRILKASWRQVPDWSFGKLILKVLGGRLRLYTLDDEEIMERFIKYFGFCTRKDIKYSKIMQTIGKNK